MNVVLIQPPSGNADLKVPPLGLAYITSMLKKNNIETKIVDLNAENINIGTYLSNEKPEIVGISSIVTNASRALEIAKTAKKVVPQSFVAMGGPYPTMIGEQLLTRHKEVDMVVMGEAEYSFLELVKTLQIGKSLESVQGLKFREGNKITHNQTASTHWTRFRTLQEKN